MFLRISFTILTMLAVAPMLLGQTPAKKKKPNVIVVITDDQGHSDLGFQEGPHRLSSCSVA